MQKTEKIDFSKLLGFETVSNEISGSVDFQDQTVSDKLGAKVGPIEPVTVANPIRDHWNRIAPQRVDCAMQKTEKIDCSKLLGFQTVGEQLSSGIDFQDETIGDKLGAKVGLIEPAGEVTSKFSGNKESVG